jgi:hypothetical protein
VLNASEKPTRLLGLEGATRQSNGVLVTVRSTADGGRTPRVEDLAEGAEPSAALVADVEERMEAWVDEIGIWAVFQVMTMIAQVMEMVSAAGDVDGSA